MSSTELESDFDTRLERALAILAASGIRRSTYAPPLYRALWHYGAHARPPHFRSWEANFFTFGGFAGVLGGAFYWLALSLKGEDELALIGASATALFVTVVTGFSRAARYKREAEDHGLPRWEDLVASVFD
jgi:hypothetical protein